MTWEATPEMPAATRRIVAIHRALCGAYGCPVPYFHHHDPLSELVSSLLSHRTRNQQSGQAFKALRARYARWEDLRDADVAEVQGLIGMVTWPELKAPRLQAILREITARLGQTGRQAADAPLSLDFLRDMPMAEARRWLLALSGVGPKTAAATLLFSDLRMAAMPVDSHHHRVALRLGLIPPKTSEGKSHALLEAMLPPGLPAQEVYDHHEVMMFHGQRCCFDRRPACGRCVLAEDCPTGGKPSTDDAKLM